ncbi:fungal peroxidase [Dendrothele bispora CBS 962.96]|uniref:Fungal peroxidase n=1 Tax=Dendrothele bispora (strain CBS 962.96) TaxID=1314807 RepID=A0A4S8ME02_DENBC|nr:fungal peroxidase [Dendrothele bispora CBS 962.96]
MKLSYLSIIIGLAVQSALAVPKQVKPRRTSSILINPDAQPDLPSPQAARLSAVSPANAGLNLNDIQGDILIGMKKKKELFFFFGIKDAATFKSKLASDIKSLVTTTNQLLSVSTQPITAVNIAFSQTGLNALSVTDSLGESLFAAGQFADRTALGDVTSNWVPEFSGTNVHGVILLASDTDDNIQSELANIKNILGSSITEISRLSGASRPGDQEGHEHFGYMDGISQPAVQGFTQNVLPGQALVSPGEILVGTTGDSGTRPTWAAGGSFLAFRKMQQKVPEFNKYVIDHALSVPGLNQQENTDLFGARVIGRWKSGAPVDLSPLRDDPVLAADPNRNNNFTFDHPDVPGFNLANNQTDCPFSAHIRKTHPRKDLGSEATLHHIMRAGIPYGPEVTDSEHASNKSSTDPSLERGLAFVAYQSSIQNGFHFMQQTWVNNANFIFGKPTPPGVDPIIGRVSSTTPMDTPRIISGTNPLNGAQTFSLDVEFVINHGGEYFFSPPISALSGRLAA